MQQSVEEIGCHIELHHKESPNCTFLNIANQVDFQLKTVVFKVFKSDL